MLSAADSKYLALADIILCESCGGSWGEKILNHVFTDKHIWKSNNEKASKIYINAFYVISYVNAINKLNKLY